MVVRFAATAAFLVYIDYMPKEYIAVVRGILWSFTDITPAELDRSGRNLTGKRGLRWDARLENFGALRPTAAR